MDEQTTRKVMEMRAVQARIEEGQRQLQSLQSFTNELAASLNTLKNLQDAKAGDSLFPMGSGVFIKAAVSDAKVLVEVGAGVVAEKTPEEAVDFLQKRFDEVLKAGSLIQQDLNAMMDRNDALVDELQKGGVK